VRTDRRRGQPPSPRRDRAGTSPPVLLDRDGPILTLTLNRPDVLNAYDRAMRDQVYEALGLASDDASIRVLVVRGAGRAFSSGGDLAEFGTAPSPTRAREVRQMRDVWGRWSRLPCVSIAAVHGIAAGGGLEMALLCDQIVCTTDARFGLPETGLGLIPGVGGTQTLPRAIGLGRAASMLLAGAWLTGREAARVGLAVEAVPSGRLEGVVRHLAERIAAVDERLLRGVKDCMRRGRDLTLAEGLALERRWASALRARDR
jgi:enoyl-CoA hydratase/carnithine racemase